MGVIRSVIKRDAATWAAMEQFIKPHGKLMGIQ
jgi:hypothetical protein